MVIMNGAMRWIIVTKHWNGMEEWEEWEKAPYATKHWNLNLMNVVKVVDGINGKLLFFLNWK